MVTHNFRTCDSSLFNRVFLVVTEIPYSKKLWRGKNFGEFGESQQFANFFLPIFLFCNMRRAQQCEMHFNLFFIRIEVRISILQYFKRSNSLSNDTYILVIATDHSGLYYAPCHHQTTCYQHSLVWPDRFFRFLRWRKKGLVTLPQNLLVTKSPDFGER